MRRAAEGLVILLVGVFAVWGALQVPPAPAGEIWAGVLPMTAALLIALGGGWLAYAGYRSQPVQAEAAPSGTRSTVIQVLGFFAGALVYQQAITLFGYELPTAIAAPLALWMFGVRSVTGLMLAAVLCPLIFHLVFFRLLGVFPPYGEVFNPTDLLGG